MKMDFIKYVSWHVPSGKTNLTKRNSFRCCWMLSFWAVNMAAERWLIATARQWMLFWCPEGNETKVKWVTENERPGRDYPIDKVLFTLNMSTGTLVPCQLGCEEHLYFCLIRCYCGQMLCAIIISEKTDNIMETWHVLLSWGLRAHPFALSFNGKVHRKK